MPVFRRSLAVALTVLAVGALLYLPLSAAGAGRNSTNIVISIKFPAFHGKLSSPRKGCLGSRKVKMFRLRGGEKRLLGKDRSADDGKWMIRVKKLTSGSYYATVANRGKCRADKSKVLTID